MKLLRVILSILAVILVFSSFPVRDILGYQYMSDALRITGFSLADFLDIKKGGGFPPIRKTAPCDFQKF